MSSLKVHLRRIFGFVESDDMDPKTTDPDFVDVNVGCVDCSYCGLSMYRSRLEGNGAYRLRCVNKECARYLLLVSQPTVQVRVLGRFGEHDS